MLAGISMQRGFVEDFAVMLGVSQDAQHAYCFDQMMISLIRNGFTHIEARAINFQDVTDTDGRHHLISSESMY